MQLRRIRRRLPKSGGLIQRKMYSLKQEQLRLNQDLKRDSDVSLKHATSATPTPQPWFKVCYTSSDGLKTERARYKKNRAGHIFAFQIFLITK